MRIFESSRPGANRDAVSTNLAPIDLHNEGLLTRYKRSVVPKELKQQESIDGHLG